MDFFIGLLPLAIILVLVYLALRPGKVLFCSVCGHEGPVKLLTKGSLGIEILLWCLFIFPGLIYSLWRLSSKVQVCSSCGASQLIPINSPVAIAAKKRIEDEIRQA